jgi:hypothetical protein
MDRIGGDMGEKWSEVFGSEWEYITRLGAAISDPHDKKEFWENIKARKLADPHFSIYSLFPRSENATKRAMEECCSYVKSLQRPEEESA